MTGGIYCKIWNGIVKLDPVQMRAIRDWNMLRDEKCFVTGITGKYACYKSQ